MTRLDQGWRGGDGRIPLVAVSHWRPGTGFTRVLESLFPRLADDFSVHWLGIGYSGPERERAGYRLHPANPRGGDPYGAYTAARLAAALGAPLALLLNDLWVLGNYPAAFRSLAPRTRTVAYLPLDGELMDDRWTVPLAGLDRLVSYTEFGRRELARFGLRAAVVPHGVDAGAFAPPPEGLEALLAPGGRRAARAAAFGDAVEADAWMVLNANRPTPRKRLDLTVEGFARFAAGKPAGVRLCLHAAAADEGERTELAALVRRHGVAGRVWLTRPGEVLDDRRLTRLYQACDVGLNTSVGEGWGLVAFEHAAAGGAQVMPDHSACGELWRGAAELLPAGGAARVPFSPLAMRQTTAAEVADALERLYTDPAHLRCMARAAYRRATDPRLSWDAAAALWRDLLWSECRSTRQALRA